MRAQTATGVLWAMFSRVRGLNLLDLARAGWAFSDTVAVDSGTTPWDLVHLAVGMPLPTPEVLPTEVIDDSLVRRLVDPADETLSRLGFGGCAV